FTACSAPMSILTCCSLMESNILDSEQYAGHSVRCDTCLPHHHSIRSTTWWMALYAVNPFSCVKRVVGPSQARPGAHSLRSLQRTLLILAELLNTFRAMRACLITCSGIGFTCLTRPIYHKPVGNEPYIRR